MEKFSACENLKSFGRFSQVENQRTVKISTKDLLNQHVLLHLFNIDDCVLTREEIIKNNVTWLEYMHALILQSYNLFLTLPHC